MAAIMEPHLNMRFIDKQGEASTLSIPTTELTAANFDATIALFVAMVAEIVDTAAASLGQLQQWWFTGHCVDVSSARPASAFAQREIKWLIRGHGVSSNIPCTFTVPCANIALLSENSESLDITDPDITGFVTAVNAIWKRRLDSGNFENVVVDSITYVSAKG